MSLIEREAVSSLVLVNGSVDVTAENVTLSSFSQVFKSLAWTMIKMEVYHWMCLDLPQALQLVLWRLHPCRFCSFLLSLGRRKKERILLCLIHRVTFQVNGALQELLILEASDPSFICNTKEVVFESDFVHVDELVGMHTFKTSDACMHTNSHHDN